jgi:hypothetical protein
MTFPFSIQFNKKLEAPITVDNQQIILQYIMNSILERKADNVAFQDLAVTYKGSTSPWRGSIFKGLDSGIFTLLYKDNCWWLNYRINMRELFIVTGLMSIFVGGFTLANDGPWWIGIVAFLWLCGANWVTNVLRHGSLNTDIGLGIDELICGKTELPEDDKMTGKLKSWF